MMYSLLIRVLVSHMRVHLVTLGYKPALCGYVILS